MRILLPPFVSGLIRKANDSECHTHEDCEAYGALTALLVALRMDAPRELFRLAPNSVMRLDPVVKFAEVGRVERPEGRRLEYRRVVDRSVGGLAQAMVETSEVGKLEQLCCDQERASGDHLRIAPRWLLLSLRKDRGSLFQHAPVGSCGSPFAKFHKNDRSHKKEDQEGDAQGSNCELEARHVSASPEGRVRRRG